MFFFSKIYDPQYIWDPPLQKKMPALTSPGSWIFPVRPFYQPVQLPMTLDGQWWVKHFGRGDLYSPAAFLLALLSMTLDGQWWVKHFGRGDLYSPAALLLALLSMTLDGLVGYALWPRGPLLSSCIAVGTSVHDFGRVGGLSTLAAGTFTLQLHCCWHFCPWLWTGNGGLSTLAAGTFTLQLHCCWHFCPWLWTGWWVKHFGRGDLYSPAALLLALLSMTLDGQRWVKHFGRGDLYSPAALLLALLSMTLDGLVG